MSRHAPSRCGCDKALWPQWVGRRMRDEGVSYGAPTGAPRRAIQTGAEQRGADRARLDPVPDDRMRREAATRWARSCPTSWPVQPPAAPSSALRKGISNLPKRKLSGAGRDQMKVPLNQRAMATVAERGSKTPRRMPRPGRICRGDPRSDDEYMAPTSTSDGIASSVPVTIPTGPARHVGPRLRIRRIRNGQKVPRASVSGRTAQPAKKAH